MSKGIKFHNDTFTNSFKKALKTGIWDKDSIIQPSFLGKTIKFDDDGNVKNCHVTPDKIGCKFGDFGYENQLMKGIGKKIKKKPNKEKNIYFNFKKE